MKIFVTREILPKGMDYLKSRGLEVVVNPHERNLTHEELIEMLGKDRYDGVLCLLSDKIDDAVLEAAGPQCKIFANYAVGIDNIDLAAAAQRNVMITNTPDVLTQAVAEHAFALMIAIARRLVEADRFVRAGKFTGWEPMMFLGTEMSGKTLGVIGLGRIGRQVVHYAVRGFGMHAMYHDINRAQDFEQEYGAEYRENVDDIFRESDFISLHVPLLPSTQHLVSEQKLRLMKKTAYLINTSRGKVIDEKALTKALQEHVIAGAALDVFEEEPAIAEGLAVLPNVILTPHIGSATIEARDAMSEVAAKNIVEALEGRTPPNLVR